VALKVLSRKLLDEPDFLVRFQNEAASAGRIHHPNVVTLHESGQADDGTPCIAMEFPNPSARPSRGGARCLCRRLRKFSSKRPPMNTGNLSVTASYPWPVLAS
jgi:hypothetical protein